MIHATRRLLTSIGVFTARPAAFLVVLAFTAAWAAFSPSTLDWHALATLATWMMTLFIQRAMHRDIQAVHAKIDELLRNHPRARTELEHLDKKEPEEIEKHRDAEQAAEE